MKCVIITKKHSSFSQKKITKILQNNCFRELFCNHFGQDGWCSNLLRIRFYTLRNIGRDFFAGRGRLGNIYHNWAESTGSKTTARSNRCVQNCRLSCTQLQLRHPRVARHLLKPKFRCDTSRHSGGARCDTKIFRGCSATPVLHLQNATKSRKSAATRVARHV